MTTNDVSDTRISDERLERIAASDVASMGEAQRMARELLASRHPQPVNEPAECTCELLPPGFHLDDCPQHKRLSPPVTSQVEVTDAMLEAGEEAADGYFSIDADAGPWLRSDGYAAIFRAMLRAASIPAPERSVGVKVDEIAKIIDPHSFMPVGELEPDDHWTENMVEQGMELARSKARRILSALETPPLHKEGEAGATFGDSGPIPGHSFGDEYDAAPAPVAPMPVTITPEMREVLWAEVVFEGEGNRFLLACDEEGNLDGVHHEMSIELSADTFPVGTKIVVSEPARESTND